MRFKDEKPMWYADTEIMSAKLANKTASEIQEILDEHDVITLKTTTRIPDSIFSRISWMLILPFLFILFCIKWLVTGEGYLDTWGKKYKLLGAILKYSGIK